MNEDQKLSGQISKQLIHYKDNWQSSLYFKMLVKNTGLDQVSTESPILSSFLPTEIELNQSVIRVPIHFYSAPPGIKTLIYHLMDLFISFLTLHNHPKWNLAFRKFSVYCHM